jgi:hypothetical protein
MGGHARWPGLLQETAGLLNTRKAAQPRRLHHSWLSIWWTHRYRTLYFYYLRCLAYFPVAMMRDSTKLVALGPGNTAFAKAQIQVYSPAGEGLLLFSVVISPYYLLKQKTNLAPNDLP